MKKYASHLLKGDDVMKKYMIIVSLGLFILCFAIFAVFWFITQDSHPPSYGRKALLIGIPDYQESKVIPKLRGPKNDIKRFKKLLCSHYGFSKRDIKVLLNERATRAAIEEAFVNFLIKGTKLGDLVIFYFAGHGARVIDYNNDEDDYEDEVICPYDTIPNGGYNIILDDELGLWLSNLHGRIIVIIADCCHSGGMVRTQIESTRSIPVSRSIPIINYKPSPIVEAIPRGADIPKQAIFMTASGEEQLALETNQDGDFYGCFTFGLCDAIESLSNPSYQKLFDHTQKVVKKVIKVNPDLYQEPQIFAKADLIKLPAFQRLPVESTPLDLQIAMEQVSALDRQTHSENSQTGYTDEGADHEEVPEVIGERVLITLEKIEGTRNEEMKKLEEFLSRLPMIELSEESPFFDQRISGGKHRDLYHVSLEDRIHNIKNIEPSATLEELVSRLEKHLEYVYMVKQLAHIYHPQPSFKASIKVKEEPKINQGQVSFLIDSEKDCYIYLINLDGDGNFHIIFPNSHHNDNFIKANKTVIIPNEEMRKKFQFLFRPSEKEDIVKLIATTKKLDLESLGLTEFSESFLSVRPTTRTIFVKGVIQKLSFEDIDWSTDSVVIHCKDSTPIH